MTYIVVEEYISNAPETKKNTISEKFGLFFFINTYYEYTHTLNPPSVQF